MSARLRLLSTLKKIQTLPLYPFLFVAYPIVAFVGNNVNEVEAYLLWRPLLVSLAATAILFPLLYVFLRNWDRAALLLTVVIFLFFTYGHIYLFLKTVELSDFIAGRHRYLLPLWLGIGAMATWQIAFRGLKPQASPALLNLVSLLLLVFPLFQITSYSIQRAQAQKAVQESTQAHAASLPLGYAPDIYYIILDAYGRADALEEMFGYDNSAFISYLESTGFYVANCSLSNYSQTMLSLPSSLNFNYLSQLSNELTQKTETRAPLRALSQKNATRAFLEQQGYQIVSFATNFPVSEWKDADYFLTPPPEGMNDFEIAFAQTTLWRVPLDFAEQPLEKKSSEWYRRRTLFTLQHLEETIPGIPSPKFVFVHLIIPHPPFVFDATGGEVNPFISEIGSFPPPEIYEMGYPDQVTYINLRMEKLIPILLEASPNPPVIIIQADHGPQLPDLLERQLKILNAYYFPDNQDGLYSSISPVNTFRVILDKYFGQSYPLLEDVSYYSFHRYPYDYTVVPNTCR